ncbi:MAG: GGDEF domain-containing protein [Acidimicrobiales bacterium]|jgi:diguanylate cyclase (GGDEF)-like protein|nr:GGDEF domain-containing protein [Acidimicrobiales bacterium]
MAGELELTAWQHRLLALQRRHGSRAVVLALTAVSVVLSLAMTLASLELTAAPGELHAWSLAMAAIIPATVAPIALTLVARLGEALGHAHDRLHHLATIDDLTGAATRRAFFVEAEAMVGGPLETGEILLLGMVDADGFKVVNDTGGHATGDRALVTLVASLQDWVAGTGTVGRLGGDEFAFVRRIPAVTALHELSRLAAHCADIGTVDGRTISASYGVVEVLPGEGVDDALARADTHLYTCKARRSRTEATQQLARLGFRREP